MEQALLKKLTVLQLPKKFSASYGTLRPILHSQPPPPPPSPSTTPPAQHPPPPPPPPHLSLSGTLQVPTVKIKQAYRQCCWTWLYEQYYYSGPEIFFKWQHNWSKGWNKKPGGKTEINRDNNSLKEGGEIAEWLGSVHLGTSKCMNRSWSMKWFNSSYHTTCIQKETFHYVLMIM